MIISIIVAMDEKRGIGFSNRLPWHLSSDLHRFKKLTMNHHVIMGRKTFESINKPLSGRIMVVITRSIKYQAPGCIVVHSLKDALSLAKNNGDEEAFIIGGEAVFQVAVPLAQRIYLTRVHAITSADVFFPQISENEWYEIHQSSHPADSKNEYPTTFSILYRIEKTSP